MGEASLGPWNRGSGIFRTSTQMVRHRGPPRKGKTKSKEVYSSQVGKELGDHLAQHLPCIPHLGLKSPFPGAPTASPALLKQRTLSHTEVTTCAPLSLLALKLLGDSGRQELCMIYLHDPRLGTHPAYSINVCLSKPDRSTAAA